MIRKRFILIALFFFIFFPIVNSVFAAYLKFDKDSYNSSVNSEFSVKIMIDTEGNEVVSSDIYISYDTTVLEPLNIAPGDFFDTVTYEFLVGKIYVAGMSDNIGVGKKGIGVVATVTFKAKNSGNTTLAYICDPNVSQSSKIIKVGVDAQNIIVCSSNKDATIEIASSVGNSSDSSAASTGSVKQTSNSNSSPARLPKAGAFDNTLHLLFMGGSLIIFGVFIKVLFL